MEIFLFNTLGRKLEKFEPLEEGRVGIYCCGPTVYHFAHLGNFRSYLFQDVLVKFLRKLGYSVKHVMNITDVGHLVSDADEGEDKMVLAARSEGKEVLEIAEFYTKAFFEDAAKLNIARPDIVCRATEHIDDMLNLIKGLQEKGLVYVAGGNVYFDTSKFPNYGRLRGERFKAAEEFSRVDSDPNKKNPEDFVLWFTKSKYEGHLLLWDSEWGKGYPGWHIECSAMAIKHLGESFDIHCGGVDHIEVHHTNEIAQSEGATGKPFAKYWLHNEFVLFNNDKMSKSKGTIVLVKDIEDDGFSPLDYRYLTLTAHYRKPINFTKEALEGARSARRNLVMSVALEVAKQGLDLTRLNSFRSSSLVGSNEFFAPLAKDINTPECLSLVWEAVKTSPAPVEKIFEVDQVLGLRLLETVSQALYVDEEFDRIANQRKEARAKKDYSKADQLRAVLIQNGFEVFDLPSGQQLLLNTNFM